MRLVRFARRAQAQRMPRLSRFADFLLPRSCTVCGLGIADKAICTDCYRDLPWIRRACPACAAPLSLAQSASVPCALCQTRPLPVARVIAPLHYRFPVDRLLKTFKYRQRADFAPALAELVVPAIERFCSDADALVPVPLHRWRHARRGFNQAAELARAIGRLSGLPVLDWMIRDRATAPQSGLDAKARRRNLHGAFSAVRRFEVRHALLIDDVMTTGETCRYVAAALLDAGVEEVSIVAVARAA